MSPLIILKSGGSSRKSFFSSLFCNTCVNGILRGVSFQVINIEHFMAVLLLGERKERQVLGVLQQWWRP